MARKKIPVLATFKMVGYSPNHQFPIHVVGWLKEAERYVTTGMTIEEAEGAFVKLGEAIEKAKMNGDLNETDAIQH